MSIPTKSSPYDLSRRPKVEFEYMRPYMEKVAQRRKERKMATKKQTVDTVSEDSPQMSMTAAELGAEKFLDALKTGMYTNVEFSEPPPQRKLVGKLCKIMGEIGWIEKRGRNDFHKYNYVMEADLVDTVRSKLAEAGIFVFTSVEDVSVIPGFGKDGNSLVTQVRTVHTFHDAETGEMFSVEGVGHGEDKNDKGVYKAMTGAMKYFLMKNFLVATGDDPEDGRNDQERSDRQMKKERAPKNESQPKQALKEPVKGNEAAMKQITDNEAEWKAAMNKVYRLFAAVFGAQTEDEKNAIRHRLGEVGKMLWPDRPTIKSFRDMTVDDFRRMEQAITDGEVSVWPSDDIEVDPELGF